jgi:DNA-directed RNA polymerase subunit RPC12/RpoP
MSGTRVSNRVKVRIRCKRCGERYILKGRMDQSGVHTGFKQCVCDNASDFEYELQEQV